MLPDAVNQSSCHLKLCLVLPGRGLDLSKQKHRYWTLHVSTEFIGEKHFVFPYPHRLHCTLEDAVSTSHTPLSPLSGCPCRHYPHYTERKPDKDEVFTHYLHMDDIFPFSFFYNCCYLNRCLKEIEETTTDLLRVCSSKVSNIHVIFINRWEIQNRECHREIQIDQAK